MRARLSWRLGWYLGRDFFPLFIFSNVIILFILMMFQMLKFSDLIMGKGASLMEAGILLAAMLTSFLPISIPVSCLAAANMVIGRMSLESELIALVTSGTPVRRLLKVFLTIAAFISILSFWLSVTGVPRANQVMIDLLTDLGARNVAVKIIPGVFTENFHGLLIFTDKVDPANNSLERVFVYDERDPRLPMVIFGKTADFVYDSKKKFEMNFHNGEIHVNRKEGGSQKITFENYQLQIPVGYSFERGTQAPLALNHSDLRHEMKLLESENARASPRYRVLMLELHRRYGLPFACFLFILLGVLWGIGHFRSMRGRPIVVSLGMTVAYWTLYLIGDSLCRSGWTPAFLAVWVPNAATLALSIWLLKQKQRYV